MTEDALWYEAAMVVGITNALNVVADGLGDATPLTAVRPDTEEEAVQPLFADIRGFYACREVPLPGSATKRGMTLGTCTTA